MTAYRSGCRAAVTSICAAATLILACSVAGSGRKPDKTLSGPAILWRAPSDIESRDLYYGQGGKAHAPTGIFRFVTEDLTGTTPKFVLVAEDGAKWRAKLGREARPETVASRLLWAVGYFSDETYFVPALDVADMPHLRRGGKVVESDGAVHDVRLRRYIPDEEWVGTWSWRSCPFSDTREWYGLRVMMAVMNNWDLKDENNSIYQVRGPNPEQHYLVADLGASFGPPRLNHKEKASIEDYRRSHWMNDPSGDFVDFNVPSAPSFGYYFELPEVPRRLGLIWLGRHIPVADARWIGSLLARLSRAQIRDAFRAGGYSPAEAEEFGQALEGRIRELNRL
jgi:hypothetical protein